MNEKLRFGVDDWKRPGDSRDPPVDERLSFTRCDLHLHSSASANTHEWYSRVFGCAESYVDPVRQYELCKARGMTFVTLTDHDTIDGGLTLLDRPDFFLSEEVTVRFPENGCVMHVLAWNIDPDQHHAIQERRDDIYQLVEYLDRQGIAHGLAHPLLSPNWRLDPATFEKLLLLFPTFELVNGMTDARIQSDLEELLAGLDEDVIRSLAIKHKMSPRGQKPHRKAFTAGSDDHVHRRCGSTHTEVEGPVASPAEFLRRCMEGRGRPQGAPGDLATVSLAIHNTTYEFLRRRRGDERPVPTDPFSDLSDVVLGRRVGDCRATDADRFVDDLLAFAAKARTRATAMPDPLCEPASLDAPDDLQIVRAFEEVVDRGLWQTLASLAAAPLSFDVYGALEGLRQLACTATAASPFLFGADHLARQWAQVQRLRTGWTATPWRGPARRLAVFSDSLDQTDGVATWCQRFVSQARDCAFDVRVPYCGDLAKHPQADSLHPLPGVGSFPVPLYPGMRFHVPSLLGTLDWIWRDRITNIELATPGPMGLGGLLAGRLMRLPVTATYHTAVPALTALLDEGSWMSVAVRRLLGWFYNRVDTVFVYSAAAEQELVAMGVEAERIALLSAMVDPGDFSPDFQSPKVFRELGLDIGDRPVVLSVGRLSKEKNIPLVVEAVRRLQDLPSPPVLVVVGDGPEHLALEHRYADHRFAHFVGRRTGQTLRQLYASARAFVFASQIDTLGLVNLEAMASGIPVLVPANASIAALVDHGISAEIYCPDVAGLSKALAKVLGNHDYARRLGQNARSAIVERWEQEPFQRVWARFTGEAR